MSLAEAYQGLGQTSDEARLGLKIESEATEFGKSSYLEQKAKLGDAMNTFKRRVRPDELSAESAAGAATQVTEAIEAKPGEPLSTTQQFRPLVSSSANPIIIDADIAPGKPVRSIEVNCKIEYS
jgi:hypothetical protein